MRRGINPNKSLFLILVGVQLYIRKGYAFGDWNMP